MPWLQLRIDTTREVSHEVEAAILRQGALAVTFEDNADEPIFEPDLGEAPLWRETRVTGLFDAAVDTQAILASLIDRCPQVRESCRWEALEDKDWQREWMQHFKPIKISENFWICPTWQPPPDENAINLMLDPGLAFGTGTHPTTFLCLQWLSRQNLQGKIVVDYGCGSGILGIAALLLGADHVVGVDIDPQAILATQHNLDRNQIQHERFSVVFPDKAPAIESDFVLANILAGPLVELRNALLGLLKSGGRLCLSGILQSQRAAIKSAYAELVRFDAVTEQEEWICMSATKNAAAVGA